MINELSEMKPLLTSRYILPQRIKKKSNRKDSSQRKWVAEGPVGNASSKIPLNLKTSFLFTFPVLRIVC